MTITPIRIKSGTSTMTQFRTFCCYGDTRCIAGEVHIPYFVRDADGHIQNCKGGSIARLWHHFHGVPFGDLGSYQRPQTVKSWFSVPSMDEDGKIFHNRVVDVVDSGLRECVRVTTAGGLELTCTSDHPLATDAGFCSVEELGIGGVILVHRKVKWTASEAARERVNRPDIFVKHHPVAADKIVSNSSGDYHYKRLRRSRAVYEAEMNGLDLNSYVARLNDGALDGLKFLSRDMHVHHLDENPLNDVPSNLVVMSHGDHAREHMNNERKSRMAYIATDDIIVGIESAGVRKTYDIKMARPPHNFVADGFIVHNSGKTRFAGSSPNALFISDASERGWTTLETMPPEDFYHAGQGPVVLPVADQIDMAYALSAAERWVKAGYISTVVVDSLTFYAESWFQHELKKMIAAGGKMDTRALYGGLAQHLTDVRQMVHKWPCNVIWLALASPPDEDNKGGPMLSGKARNRFPSACDHIFYHERYLAVDEAGAEVEVYQIRTRPPANYLGGGRDSGALPVNIPWPTFRYIADCLSLPEFPRKELPDEELAKVMQTLPSQVTAQPAATSAASTTAKVASSPGRNGKPPGRPALRG